MNTEEIIRVLDEITDAEDEQQLKQMDEAVCQLDAQPSSAAVEAMLRVFERFPNKDGFETFWSLVHAIEASPDYQTSLIESVKRSPGDFNVMMIHRMLNGGIRKVRDVELLDLLWDVTKHPSASEEVKKAAQRFMDNHLEKTQSQVLS